MSSAITPELRWHAVGRRKVGVARVYLTPGSGKWNVNGRTLGDLFSPALARVAYPAAVHGDRHAGRLRRAGAVPGRRCDGAGRAMRLAIARALCLADERHRKKLREQGLLTRDPRWSSARSRAARARASGSSSVSDKSHTSPDPVLGPPRGVASEMRAAADRTHERRHGAAYVGAFAGSGRPFGHQTRRWNPKMRRFIFAERSGITSSTSKRRSDRSRPRKSCYAVSS